MKVREVTRLIEMDGWRLHSQRGSHQQYKHPAETGRVSIVGKPNADMHPKTLANVLKQAGMERQRN